MDFVARYGGEEFVVLLPETDAHGAYAVASNIFKAIDRLEIPHEKSLAAKHITISLALPSIVVKMILIKTPYWESRIRRYIVPNSLDATRFIISPFVQSIQISQMVRDYYNQ